MSEQPIWRSYNAAAIDEGLRSYMVKVFGYMALGLLLTGVTAFGISQSPALMQAIFGTPLKWVVMLAPLGVVFFLGAKIGSLSLSTAQTLFWVYSGLMGVSLSILFQVFLGESIARIFFITSSVFGGMALYGYTTQKDLTSMGSFMMMGLWGIIIASLINLFTQSSALQMVISIISVLVFTGLTAYDTQSIKETYLEGDSYDVSGKKAIFGALRLYLDFINLFIALLQLFGDRRN